MRNLAVIAAIGALATTATAVSAQGRHTADAKAELARLRAEQEVAHERVRLARQRDRLEAAERKRDAAVTGLPPTAATQSTVTATPATDAGPDAREAPPSLTEVEKVLAQARTFEDFERAREAQSAAEQFGGVELGAGFSLTFDLGSRDRIADAQIVNRIVRVTDQNNALARLLLETHYFFKPQREGPFGLPPDMWGLGPFVAIQPGDERIIEAIGLGLMIGFRREETKTSSFNIGIGMMIDPNTRVLGDGFVANAAAPDGEMEVRYRETSQKGLMLMTSFSF